SVAKFEEGICFKKAGNILKIGHTGTPPTKCLVSIASFEIKTCGTKWLRLHRIAYLMNNCYTVFHIFNPRKNYLNNVFNKCIWLISCGSQSTFFCNRLFYYTCFLNKCLINYNQG